MKIALVKKDIYQDLYVCSKNENCIGGGQELSAEILKSTLMRIGPLGLIHDFDADFYIIKEQKTKECQAYKKSQEISENLKAQLKTLPANQITAEFFSFLNPLSDKSHADFSIEPEEVDWSKYDIVISINISIPTEIVKKYKDTLWCYMYGEANFETPQYGYDCLLTQNITGTVSSGLGTIDFPYTFLGKQTLQEIAEKLFNTSKSKIEKNGIFAEINNTTERPVKNCLCIESAVSKLQNNMPVYLHNQNIIENLKNLYQAKYFVKLQGRKIRGNSVIEAISAGTLVLMNPKDVIHSQLIPEEAWIHNEQELVEKINFLEQNPQAYNALLQKERFLLDLFVIKAPVESLKNALEAKRNGEVISIPTHKEQLKRIVKKIIRKLTG